VQNDSRSAALDPADEARDDGPPNAGEPDPKHGASKPTHTSGGKSIERPGDAPSVVTLRARQSIFFLLLGAAVVFAILFGKGWLTQDVVSSYIVFVILGGLASVLTWGLLSSAGEISGTQYGFKIKLAGAIVPLVLVTGGGLWAADRTEPFAVKFKFVNAAGQAVKVSGLARLEISDDTRPVTVQDSDLATFDHLPRSAQNKSAGLTLESSKFRLDTNKKYVLHPNDLISIELVPVLITRISGTVSFDHERLPGGTIYITGRDCNGPIRNGFFEVPCDGLTTPVAVEIVPPAQYAKTNCTTSAGGVPLVGNRLDLSLSKLLENDIEVTCATRTGGEDVRHKKVCSVDADNPPKEWQSASCPVPTKPKHSAILTDNYKRRFPLQLGDCDDVFVYACPGVPGTGEHGATEGAPDR
jgi:hypothetical protein